MILSANANMKTTVNLLQTNKTGESKEMSVSDESEVLEQCPFRMCTVKGTPCYLQKENRLQKMAECSSYGKKENWVGEVERELR